MDRAIVTGMVEDYWRAAIPAMQNGGADAAEGVISRFEDRIQQTAKRMEPLEGAAFLQTMDAERERAMDEYQANPVAFKHRLGISMGIDAPRAITESGRASHSSDLGNLVVRTAIRATVWDSVRALFRAMR